MAFSKVASTQAQSSSASSITVGKPTGVAQGDILFAIVYQYALSVAMTPPSGWTAIVTSGGYSYCRIWIYYRVAGASEPSNYTWSSNKSGKILGAIVAYRGGFDTSDPIDTYGTTTYHTKDSTNRAAGISVSATNSPLLWIGGFYYTSWGATSTPSGPGTWTEDVDSGDADFWYAFFSQVWASSGSTGDVDAAISNGTNMKHASLVALNPSASTPVTVTPGLVQAGAEGARCTVGPVTTVTALSAEVSAQGLEPSVAAGATIGTLPAEAGAEGEACTSAAGSTIYAAPGEVGAEGTLGTVYIAKIVSSLRAEAGGEGTRGTVSAGCNLDVLPAEAGAEGHILDASVVVVVGVLPASAGAEGLAAEIAAGVTCLLDPGEAGAECPTFIVLAGTAGLRRTFPAMVRTYPPLCRAA